MDCPSCGLAMLFPPGPDPERLSRTHDTSTTSYRIAFPNWISQLNQAAKSASTTRFTRYSEVAVLMMCWEETYHGTMEIEMRRLASVFRTMYKYSVTMWHIPSEDPDLATGQTIMEFLVKHGHPNNLLIVYYAGHARRSPIGPYPIWQPRPQPENGMQVDTIVFHPHLVRARDNSPDVLLLYDCCFDLSSHGSNTNTSRAEVEGLFAGSFGPQVSMPGQHSFTKHLIDALATTPQPLTIVELHRQIIARLSSPFGEGVFDKDNNIKMCNGKALYTKDIGVTPSHLFLAGNENPRTLALIPPGTGEVNVNESNPDEDQSDWPMVLLAVSLFDDNSVQNWLLKAPPGVQYRGIFPGFSSLLLVEVTVAIWDLLPSSPAVSFLSFTTNSRVKNLLTRISFIGKAEQGTGIQGESTKSSSDDDVPLIGWPSTEDTLVRDLEPAPDDSQLRPFGEDDVTRLLHCDEDPTHPAFLIVWYEEVTHILSIVGLTASALGTDPGAIVSGKLPIRMKI
ncbi:hypothetical protein F5Y10DRAFT_270291 [Nemania abortiva]|nr:hypothetical protein F5Y10DRAFT_270291 [Nemania abortiva]